MNLKNLLGTLFLGTLAGCHAPVLLTELSPESQPKEKFKYYQPDFKLDKNSLLNLNGYYLSSESERKLNLTLKRYNELKEKGISPAGFDIKELQITSDTTLLIKERSTLKFYQDGTYSSIIFSNKSREEIHREMLNRNNQLTEGGSVFKLEGNTINYEYYSKMSVFSYAEGKISQHSVTFGKSEPYEFIRF